MDSEYASVFSSSSNVNLLGSTGFVRGISSSPPEDISITFSVLSKIFIRKCDEKTQIDYAFVKTQFLYHFI